MNEREKKMFASFVLLILMAATLIASLTFRTPGAYVPPGVEREFLIRVRENVAVTTVAEPNNEPSIAVDPKDPDHIVAAGNDYGTPNGDAWVGYYVSWDGGKTWSRDLIPGYFGDLTPPLSGYDGAGDPVVLFGPEGNVYIAGICFKRASNPLNPFGLGLAAGRDNGIFVAKSTDGGVTFNEINILITALHTPIAFHDKEWMAVDMNNGNVYVAWAVFTLLSRVNILLSRSTDGGNSFSLPRVVSDFFSTQKNMQGTTIQVTPDSRVHLFWTDFGGGGTGDEEIMYIYSNDNGQSFTSPRPIAQMTEIPYNLPNTDYRTPTLLMSAVDLSETNTSGYLYVTWNDYRHNDADIYLIYSWDNGESWSEPIRVNDDEEGNGLDQFFPAVAVSHTGIVNIFFYDRRDDEDNTLIRCYFAQSYDGGQNFTTNINISDEPFDGNNAPHTFIGDYSGMSAHNNSAYAIWCDCREGTGPGNDGDSELYFTRIDFGWSDEEPFLEEEK